jgi:transcription elongation factor GreA
MREIKNRLESELRALEHEFRVELPKEIGTAVAMGDLRENAEYHAALERQRLVQARITALRQRLGELNALSMERVPHDRAGLGSTVRLLDLRTNAEVTYELVVPELAELERGLISVASPIGRGIVGKAEGDEFTIHTPNGVRQFELLELRTIHAKEQGS